MYYPKSKVTENLYTAGGEFVVQTTGKSYAGAYHSTYDGNNYTGATHTATSQLLITAAPSTGAISPTGSYLITAPYITGYEYDQITNNQFAFLKSEIIPVPYYAVPQDTDYTNGQFIRYFTKRIGGSAKDIMEIDSTGYSDLSSNVLYLSTSVQWKLTGPVHDQVIDLNNTVYGVYDTNARTVARTEATLPGITQYLSNFVEFAKFIS